MDVTNIIESPYVSIEFVKGLPQDKRVGVIVSEDGEDKKVYGTFPKFVVEINGKNKQWTPNVASCQNLAVVYGKDSSGWVGQKIRFDVGRSKKNQEMVVSSPVEPF